MKFGGLLDIGIERCDPDDVRRVRTVNLLLLFAILFTTGYSLIYLFLGVYPVIYFNLLMIVVQGLLLYGVTKGFNRFAGLGLAATMYLQLAVITFVYFPHESGIHYYYFAVISLSFLVTRGEDRFWLILVILASLFTFTVVEYIRPTPVSMVELPPAVFSKIHAASTLGTVFLILMVILVFYIETTRIQENLKKERDRSEGLLLNILPSHIAEKLKTDHEVIADNFTDSTVLFADMVGFSSLVSEKSPEWVVKMLNEYFRAFDTLVVKFGVEKIKTIGDAYMAVSGVPVPKANHAHAMIELAIEMLESCRAIGEENGYPVRLRIGINSGPVAAGVIGHRKFVYDIWGDTVNIASRMESNGIPDAIQISDSTYQIVHEQFRFKHRGKLQLKGRDPIEIYTLRP